MKSNKEGTTEKEDMQGLSDTLRKSRVLSRLREGRDNTGKWQSTPGRQGHRRTGYGGRGPRILLFRSREEDHQSGTPQLKSEFKAKRP